MADRQQPPPAAGPLYAELDRLAGDASFAAGVIRLLSKYEPFVEDLTRAMLPVGFLGGWSLTALDEILRVIVREKLGMEVSSSSRVELVEVGEWKRGANGRL